MQKIQQVAGRSFVFRVSLGCVCWAGWKMFLTKTCAAVTQLNQGTKILQRFSSSYYQSRLREGILNEFCP